MAHDAVIFYNLGGVAAATAMARERSVGAHAPWLVEIFCEQAEDLLAGLDTEPTWQTVLALEPGPNTDSLTETLTAANGDTLTILCNQVLEEVSPGVYRGTDTWTVIGGTGRFSDATGSGSGETHVDLNVDTFSKVMTGDITY